MAMLDEKGIHYIHNVLFLLNVPKSAKEDGSRDSASQVRCREEEKREEDTEHWIKELKGHMQDR